MSFGCIVFSCFSLHSVLADKSCPRTDKPCPTCRKNVSINDGLCPWTTNLSVVGQKFVHRRQNLSADDKSCPWRRESRPWTRGGGGRFFIFLLRPVWSDKSCPSRTNRVRGQENVVHGQQNWSVDGKRVCGGIFVPTAYHPMDFARPSRVSPLHACRSAEGIGQVDACISGSQSLRAAA